MLIESLAQKTNLASYRISMELHLEARNNLAMHKMGAKYS